MRRTDRHEKPSTFRRSNTPWTPTDAFLRNRNQQVAAARSSELPGSFLLLAPGVRRDSALLARLVESHVEEEHVDAGLAEHAKLATFRVGPDELANGVLGQLASLRDAGDL